MNAFLQMLGETWPGMLLVSGIVGGIIAWIATQNVRRQLASVNAEVISVLREEIKAKDSLAKSVGETSAQQIKTLMEERASSDSRHEKLILERTHQVHELRNELQACANEKALLAADLAELRGRTDFRPVMDFLETAYAENASVQKQTLAVLSVVAPVLERVMSALNMSSATKVEVVNTEAHPIPVKT